MNIENLKRLRSKLVELDDSQFDMGDFQNYRGTVCCVAGWALKWFGEDKKPDDGNYYCFIKEFLDIHNAYYYVVEWLCVSFWAKNFNTVADAVKRLDYLIENGLPPEDFKETPFKYYSGSCAL